MASGNEIGELLWKLGVDPSGFNKGVNAAQKKVGGLQSFVKKAGVAIGGAFVAMGAAKLGKEFVSLAIGAEQTKVSFTTFLKSAEKADVLIKKLQDFSVVTPFTIDQINQATKGMLGMGIAQENIIPNLQKIGDVAAGTGKDFGELSLIFSKASAAGTIFSEDINQLSEAGIPIIGQFAKQFGVAESEIKKMASEGKIQFSDLDQAFSEMTGEGGLFFNLMNAQSQTLGGKISTLQGNFSLLGAELGGLATEGLGDVVDFLNDMLAPAASSEQITNDLVTANNNYKIALDALNESLKGNSEEQILNNSARESAARVDLINKIEAQNKKYKELETTKREFDRYNSQIAGEDVIILPSDNEELEIAKEKLKDINDEIITGLKAKENVDALNEKAAAYEKTIARIQGEKSDNAKALKAVELEIAGILNSGNDTLLLRSKIDENLLANAEKTKDEKAAQDKADKKALEDKNKAEKKAKDLLKDQKDARDDAAKAAKEAAKQEKKDLKDIEKLRLEGIVKTEQEIFQEKLDRLDAYTKIYSKNAEILSAIDKARANIIKQEGESVFGFTKSSYADLQKTVSDFNNNVGATYGAAVAGMASLFSSINEYVTASTEKQIEDIDRSLEKELGAIDERTQAELESKGLLEETELEKLENEYAIAKEKGDEGLAEDLRRQIERTKILEDAEKEKDKINKDAEKKKADLEYKASLRAWKFKLFEAIATAPLAAINALNTGFGAGFPVGIALGPALATVATVASGIQIAAISKSKPQKPSFAVGIADVPHNMSADIHKGEMIISEPFAESVRKNEISIGGGSEKQNITLNLITQSGELLKKYFFDASKDGTFNLDERAIVSI